MANDWQTKFQALYKAVAACEAPQGTQVDDVLAEYQADFERPVTTPWSGVIEILHGRDPDSGCEHTVFVDGNRHDAVSVESVDPGAGYAVEDWDEHTDWVESNEEYSQSFRNAVAAERQGARSSDYIIGNEEENQ